MSRSYLIHALIASFILNLCLFLYQTHFSLDYSAPQFSTLSGRSKVKDQNISWENYNLFTKPIDLLNSTALFNSVSAALKQKDSDVHPVGVCYFPAVIPKGTLMYHSGPGKIPESFEWLAMDYEFSFSFGQRRKSRGKESLKRDRHSPPSHSSNGAPSTNLMPPNQNSSIDNSNDIRRPPVERNFWTMMTYRAKRDLNRLIYVDGASAAKTKTGEMDTQELLSNIAALKLNLTEDPGDWIEERLFASRICKWGEPFGLDGIIRLEIGFEIILCDFLNGSIELVSNVSFPTVDSALGLPSPVNLTRENGWPINDDGELIEDELTKEQELILEGEDRIENYLQETHAMLEFEHIYAGMVHDTGDKRIELDYRYLVTGINRTWISPDPNMRRLLSNNTSLDLQLGIVVDLENALQLGFDSTQSTNWQLVSEEIVNKFTPLILVLDKVLNSTDSTEMIARNSTVHTLNFIRRFWHDTGSNDFEQNKEFAIYQYTHPTKPLTTESDYLIWSSMVRVVKEIIDTIYDIHFLMQPIIKSRLLNEIMDDDDASTRIKRAHEMIASLKKSLNWVSFAYKCNRLCGPDEICYTPNWGPGPFGWVSPDDQHHFGMTYDNNRNRLTINRELQCINVQALMNFVR